MLSDFDFAKTDRIPASELSSTDLGRLAVVTHHDNTVIGQLRAYTFSNFHNNAKLGPTFSVALTLGTIDVLADYKTEIWLARE